MNRTRLTPDQRQQVIELKKTNSYSEVVKITGLPIGTVRSIVRRSGQLSDNPKHRALFTLPPIQHSTSTSLAIVDIPPQQSVTGDKEVDAMLWLREMIKTGKPEFIEKALLAAKKIKTPAKQLEDSYSKWLIKNNAGNFFAGLGAMGFADLGKLADRTIKNKLLEAELKARLGDDAEYVKTEAEQFCFEVVGGLGELDDDRESKAEALFNAYPEYLPHTLSDCVHELQYWDNLYLMRNAIGSHDDPNASIREQFIQRLLAKIRPRSPSESKAVLKHLIETETLNQSWFDTDEVLENLLNL